VAKQKEDNDANDQQFKMARHAEKTEENGHRYALAPQKEGGKTWLRKQAAKAG
jgi:hypothetical protein